MVLGSLRALVLASISLQAPGWRKGRITGFLLAGIAVAAAGPDPASAQDYLLSPQDKLNIRVFEWRPSSGTFFEWVPLTGEFAVSAAGNLSLPVIGIVPAAGKTAEQISLSIGDQLQKQVGLQRQPNVSVEISSYRPFYVTGLVGTPGKYVYTPNMTVIQALSMAGGIGSRDANLVNIQRDALSARGEIRALAAEWLELLSRQARVDATINNAVEVKFPPELTTRENEPEVARMMRQEKSLFDIRMRSMQAEIDALNQTKILVSNQIDGLKEKSLSLAKQIELANKELGSINKLVTEGLTVSSRRLGANQDVADLESRDLDVSLAILKAQQDLAKIAQDIEDVRDRYRINALTEAAELRSRFASNVAHAKTAADQLKNLDKQAPVAIANLDEDEENDRGPMITIDRVIDGANQNLIVGDNTPIEPGDVIRVERRNRNAKITAVANSK